MQRYILIFFFASGLISCGGDVVEITDTQLPLPAEEIYEVNLRGFVQDAEGNYLPQATITVDGLAFEADQNGYFTIDNELSDLMGTVLLVSEEGFLPTFQRVYDHRSIESVGVSVQAVSAPEAVKINDSGTSLEINDDVSIVVGSGDLPTNTNVTVWVASDRSAVMDPLFIKDGAVEILHPEVLCYFSSDNAILGSNHIDLVVDEFSVTISDNLRWFYYDEDDLRWISRTSPISSGGQYMLPIDDSGWWTLASSSPAVHGALRIGQPDGMTLRNVSMSIESLDNPLMGTSVLHTDKAGTAHRFFADGEVLRVGSHDFSFSEDVQVQFSNSDPRLEVQLDQDLYESVQISVSDCDFFEFEGFVKLEEGTSFSMQEVDATGVDLVYLEKEENLGCLFYSTTGDYVDEVGINLTRVENQSVSTVACRDQMTISTQQVIVEDFDQCRIRVKPNESFVIGERMSGEKFLVSFAGDTTGSYQGLMYAISLSEFDVGKIESQAAVNIEVYDLATNTIAGDVIGRYVDGEEFLIRFVGSIE